MKRKIKILELFGGIGAPRKAFLNLGFEVQSDYVEINKNVVEVYNKIYEENNVPLDVVSFKTNKEYDYLIAGFPCQPFSQAGKRLGFNDPRGKLYKDTLRIINEVSPNKIILENVKGILRKENIWIIKEIEKKLIEMEYSVLVKTLNSFEYGFRQKRERVFIIATKTNSKKLIWEDFIFMNFINKNSYNKKFSIKDFKTNSKKIPLNNIKELNNFWVIPRSSDGKLINGSYNRIWKINKQLGTIASSNTPKIGFIPKDNNFLYYRKLTPKESFLFMGFSNEDYRKVKHFPPSILFHTTGNSMIVGIIELIIIFLELLKNNQ